MLSSGLHKCSDLSHPSANLYNPFERETAKCFLVPLWLEFKFILKNYDDDDDAAAQDLYLDMLQLSPGHPALSFHSFIHSFHSFILTLMANFGVYILECN